MQAIRSLRCYDRDKSDSLTAVDDFTRSMANNITLLKAHTSSAKAAIGTDLNPAMFYPCVSVDVNEKEIFNNVRVYLKDLIKDYRVSRKVKIKEINEGNLEEGIFYGNEKNPIELPQTFNAVKRKILDILKSSIPSANTDQANNATKVISPASFSDLFLTQEQFKNAVGNENCVSVPVYELSSTGKTSIGLNNFFDDIQGFNPAEKRKLKEILLRLEPVTFEQFSNYLMDINPNINVQTIIQYLEQKDIFSKKSLYRLSDHCKSIINDHLSTIKWRPSSSEFDSKIKKLIEDHPIFSHRIDIIRDRLINTGQLTYQDENTENRNLDFTKEEFQDLSTIFYQYGCTSERLIDKLKLPKDRDGSFDSDIESELLYIYKQTQHDIKGLSNISLPPDNLYMPNKLWMFLKSNKIVKDPAVKFKPDQEKDPKTLLNEIKDAIDKSYDQINPHDSTRELHVARLKNIFENSIGKLRTLKNIKVTPKQLEDFVKGNNCPEELSDFKEAFLDLVLSLSEDDSFDWNSVVGIVIGLLEIGGGVLAGYVMAPGNQLISVALLYAGIEDFIFSLQAGFNHTFTYSSFIQNKLLHLSKFFGEGLREMKELSKLALAGRSLRLLAKKFDVHLDNANDIFAVAASFTKSLIEKTFADFSTKVGGQLEQFLTNEINNKSGSLKKIIMECYNKYGEKQTAQIITDILEKNKADRKASYDAISQHLTPIITSILNELSVYLKNTKESQTNLSKIETIISSVITTLSRNKDNIQSLKSIATEMSKSFPSLEDSLKEFLASKHKQYKEVDVVNEKQSHKEDFCNTVVESNNNQLIHEMVQFFIDTSNSEISKLREDFTELNTSFISDKISKLFGMLERDINEAQKSDDEIKTQMLIRQSELIKKNTIGTAADLPENSTNNIQDQDVIEKDFAENLKHEIRIEDNHSPIECFPWDTGSHTLKAKPEKAMASSTKKVMANNNNCTPLLQQSMFKQPDCAVNKRQAENDNHMDVVKKEACQLY